MSSKSKSSASEASNKKASSPATPRLSKLGSKGGKPKSGADSPSPLQKPRLSIDHSPGSVTSKPVSDRKAPKPSTTTDKQTTHVLKGTELQTQLTAVQEELKNVKEKLALSAKEEAQAAEEAKEAKRLADEANEKLGEALVAQRRAEEDSEIERFRVVELEQVGIETAEKDEKWKKELESVRNQHALDLCTLASTTEELQRVKQELAMTTNTKNQALIQADSESKIAESFAEKMRLLTAELDQVKASMKSKLEKEASEKNELITQLNTEINSLRLELEKIMIYEEKLSEKDHCIEDLNAELEAAKKAESNARKIAEEWKRKAEALDVNVEEVNQMERSVSENLSLVTKKLEEKSSLLLNAESVTFSLIEKVGLLEVSVSQQKEEIEESEFHLELAKGEAAQMSKRIEGLVCELEIVKEKNIEALNNEKVAACSFEKVLEEKVELVKELESLRDQHEKNKKETISLTAALHEVSTEARGTKEKLLSSQAEKENYESEIENLEFSLNSTREKYDELVGEAQHEIDSLNKSIESWKDKYQSLKEELEKKELHFADCVKQFEEKRDLLEEEIRRLTSLYKENEQKACEMEAKGDLMANTLKEAETDVIQLKEALRDAKSESMRTNEILVVKENEIQSLIRENQPLRNKEAASLKRIQELSKLLEESMVIKQKDENGDISDSEKDYDMLPKVVEFSEENGVAIEGNTKIEDNDTLKRDEVENLNGFKEYDKSNEKEDDSVEVDSKMWASCKIEENEFSMERSIEQESFEEHINCLPSSETRENGETSPLEQRSQKKKKPLLKKFGSLLKKKSAK